MDIFPNMITNASAKEAIRYQMRQKIREMSSKQKEIESKSIVDQLSFFPGEKVAFFSPLPSEPNLFPLVARFPETVWFLPKLIDDNQMIFIEHEGDQHLQKGPYGILEPTGKQSCSSFTTILCPGLAFTRHGKRLGQGGGYYDRFLATQSKAKKIGICFHCQIVDEIPMEDHDILLDEIMTTRER